MNTIVVHDNLCAALHATVLSLRRCTQKIKETKSGVSVTCNRSAIWRKKESDDGSYFLCDLCFHIFVNEENWEQAPHANALRKFVELVPSKIDLKKVQSISIELLLALPPCPLPLSYTSVCPRCIWADGFHGDGCFPGQESVSRLYVARSNLMELTRLVTAFRKDPFEKWCADDYVFQELGESVRYAISLIRNDLENVLREELKKGIFLSDVASFLQTRDLDIESAILGIKKYIELLKIGYSGMGRYFFNL